ncbi:multidrug ABC transporter ATP-binding and permease protein [Secundilactobacillus pentosiphilus]|uniref:Multidrug ABC transporter ATP-binding and permease protein n=1 Tax=Secundilactobacillus pentosiphilus TaxID=1714682 RepID=A0A1Z5IP20_9LACO|nr:ABC transporter ATP-binding protein [Secundilactobacillus pentosiphilus]GAX03368.1 multidrug ABC transporter ATP-binding and permease protein [Secundilactobacillus pentosiphilus]
MNGRRETFWRLLRLLVSDYKGWLSVSLIAIILSALSGVAGSLFIQRLIDHYIMPLTRTANPDFKPLLFAIGVMAVIFYVGVMATVIYSQIMAVIGQRIQEAIRDRMFEKMQSLPLRYFDQNDYGNVMSRYTNDVDTLMQLITQSFPQFVVALFNVTFALGAMLLLSPVLTVVSLAIFAASIVIVRWLTHHSARYFRAQQASLGQLDAFVEEMLNGERVIKVFSHEKQVQAAFETYNDALRNDARYANGFATMLFPIMGNMGNLLYVLITLLGGSLAIVHPTLITLGTIAAFLQLSRSFSQPIAQISQQLNSIVQAMAGAGRIFQLLDEQPEDDRGTTTLVKEGENWFWQPADPSQSRVPVRGDIQFQHVNFTYPQSKAGLHDLNFEAQAGTKIALVGETGAGKTTTTNMLNRFYDIDSGQIMYDGVAISTIKKADLRRALAIVLQDTHLFTGTIRDNIRYGVPEADDAAVIAAAQLARADVFIKKLPAGYDTEITGDGEELSSGQRQMLAIARAAIVDPPVMILDEATSNIDTRTERLVQAGMDNLMANRTTFVIAHRLSTVFNADLILVIDNGRIIERGTHEELLRLHGRYYELYQGLA